MIWLLFGASYVSLLHFLLLNMTITVLKLTTFPDINTTCTFLRIIFQNALYGIVSFGLSKIRSVYFFFLKDVDQALVMPKLVVYHTTLSLCKAWNYIFLYDFGNIFMRITMFRYVNRKGSWQMNEFIIIA